MCVPRRQPLRTRGRGTAQRALPSPQGVTKPVASRSPVEPDAREGESPVGESQLASRAAPE